MTNIRDQVLGMTAVAREVLRCLFFHGPTLDRDIPSKPGRGVLVSKGLADRHQGYTFLTRAGIELAVDVHLLGEAKERWENERRAKS